MIFVDTHCHIHEATLKGKAELSKDEEITRSKWIKAGSPKPEDIIKRAKEAGVNKLICVGTTASDSELAVRFVADKPECFASIGIHPHEAEEHLNYDFDKFAELAEKPKVVAVGEIGLDYYYENSSKSAQKQILIKQLEIAKKYYLPVIFHIRGSKDAPTDAFDDLFAILSDFEGVRGVVHSFTADNTTLDKILALGLYIGLNGIMTFTKDQSQLEMAKKVPADKLVLETDAPYLTPNPHRGKICEPMYLRETAVFLADLRDEKLDDLAKYTTGNARKLFKL
ncbi:MAG TPA: TatD family hydrolase [Candidatus Saccharibacteria bacterium]|nr:TatD family hydrolase [Candidatus Saccharibacteria bacterium]